MAGYDVLCRQLTNASGWAVFSVDYGLAPEHPFPAAQDDALQATNWVADNANLLEVDPLHIALGGDSAGGNLSIVTALRARDRFSPHFAISLDLPMHRDPQPAGLPDPLCRRLLSRSGNPGLVFRRYLQNSNTEDWRASPVRATSLAGLPSMFLITASRNPLTDGCLAFAERVGESGGEVEHLPVAGMVHGFLPLGKRFPLADATLEAIAEALARTAI